MNEKSIRSRSLERSSSREPALRSGAHPFPNGLAPSWASDFGEDEFGAFVVLRIKDALQRFRWIPPGEFTQGSPPSEPGRYENEGPQRRVRFTRGFWLGDTPVTQVFWEAFGKENPSRFRSPDRPVERVSWSDCKTFIAELNRAIAGALLQLPSEAQWEYACRARTTTMTYIGDVEILGANNAPALDEIAWYGGNCGVNFELEEGEDISRFGERHHKEKRGGTHPVARLRPNAWGLYDMLGNVYEWCEDAWDGETYLPGSVTDPLPSNGGARRVFRGGSWISVAQYVRAAYRDVWDWRDPDDRYGNLGFRLARGQED
jgi:sulfatase modifying factor 1